MQIYKMSSEKDKQDKSKVNSQVKHVPKDAQVVMSILKELNVQEYEPRVINQLLEFTYRYVTCILDDAKVFANHAKKKTIELEDVKLATEVVLDKAFTCPPPRHILAKLAEVRNTMPLPPIKPHCGLRLPPDRYCLSACNYKLRATNQPKKMSISAVDGRSGVHPIIKTTTGITRNIVKRQTVLTPKTQVVTIPKPVIKFTTTTKTISLDSKTALSGGLGSGGANDNNDVKMEMDMDGSAASASAVGNIPGAISCSNSGGVKREREEDEFEIVQL